MNYYFDDELKVILLLYVLLMVYEDEIEMYNVYNDDDYRMYEIENDIAM